MKNILYSKLSSYNPISKEDYIRSLKEIIQELTLYGLSKTDFFDSNLLSSDSASRHFYHLNRFINDLTFVVTENSFDFNPYLDSIKKIYKLFNIKCLIKKDENYYIECPILENLRSIGVDSDSTSIFMRYDKIRINIYFINRDISKITYKYLYGTYPMGYLCKVVDSDTIFASIIKRIINSNASSKDYYDYIYYLKNNTNINYAYLDNDNIKEKLIERFSSINYRVIKDECYRYSETGEVDNFSSNYFVMNTKEYIKS